MLTLKRSSLAAVTGGIALSLAGCSDFPGEGVIDTKELRTHAAIVEVEGNVYGIKQGGVDAYAVYEHDQKALNRAERNAWNAYSKGEGIPKIELQFEGDTTGFDLGAFQAALEAAVDEAKTKVDAEIAEEIAEAQKRRDDIAQKIEEASKGGDKFAAYVADAKAEFEAAQKALNTAIDKYNAAIASPLDKLNEIAEANGLEKVSSYQNPVKSYRTIDFSKRSVPSSCPNQRGYTSVNLLAEQKLCAYIRLDSRFEPYSNDVVSVTKTALINIPKLKEQIGRKGGWSTKGTGAYATLAEAEDAYKKRVSEARNKFGNDRQREYRLSSLNRDLERMEGRLADLKSDENRNSAMILTTPDLSDEAEAAADAYIDGLKANVVGYIEKGPAITMGEKDAKFEGFSGDYEGAAIVADFIFEDNGRRDNLTSIHYVDLTDEAVKSADAITVAVGKESFTKGRFIDIRDAEDIEKAILKVVEDEAEERAEADKA